MLDNLSLLLVNPDLGARTRLREVLAQVVYKGKFHLVRTYSEAVAVLGEAGKIDCVFVASDSDRDELTEFIDRVRGEDPEKAPLIIVTLKSEHQDSTYIASLFLAGIQGFVKQPYSADQVRELLATARDAKGKTTITDGVKNEVLIRFLISDALRHVTATAQNLSFGRSGGYSMKNLQAVAQTIKTLSKDIHPDVVEQIWLDNFADKKFPKHYKAKRRSATVLKKAVHPGVKVREVMAQINLSEERLKAAWKLDPLLFDQLLQEKESITSDVAHELARVLGRNPQFWLGIQADYDKGQAAEAKRGVQSGGATAG